MPSPPVAKQPAEHNLCCLNKNAKNGHTGPKTHPAKASAVMYEATHHAVAHCVTMCENVSDARQDCGADSADEPAKVLVFFVNIERLHYNTVRYCSHNKATNGRTSRHNASSTSVGPVEWQPEAIHSEQQRIGSGPLTNTLVFLVQALHTTRPHMRQ